MRPTQSSNRAYPYLPPRFLGELHDGPNIRSSSLDSMVRRVEHTLEAARVGKVSANVALLARGLFDLVGEDLG